MTYDDYIKRRDEIIKKISKYNHVDCGDDQCAFLVEAQQAIDELVLAVIGEDEDVKFSNHEVSLGYGTHYDLIKHDRNLRKSEQRSVVKGES